jgi:hypothetical protein
MQHGEQRHALPLSCTPPGPLLQTVHTHKHTHTQHACKALLCCWQHAAPSLLLHPGRSPGPGTPLVPYLMRRAEVPNVMLPGFGTVESGCWPREDCRAGNSTRTTAAAVACATPGRGAGRRTSATRVPRLSPAPTTARSTGHSRRPCTRGPGCCCRASRERAQATGIAAQHAGRDDGVRQ